MRDKRLYGLTLTTAVSLVFGAVSRDASWVTGLGMSAARAHALCSSPVTQEASRQATETAWCAGVSEWWTASIVLLAIGAAGLWFSVRRAYTVQCEYRARQARK
jgi:hypothetical protein